jgi:hypothetical protein
LIPFDPDPGAQLDILSFRSECKYYCVYNNTYI